MKRLIWFGIVLVSAALILGKVTDQLTLDWLEVIGFITGLVDVWLAVKNNHWNWPVGNMQSAAYLLLFFNARLYANSFLQLIFIVLGFWGWYQWLRGGEKAAHHEMIHTSRNEAIFLIVLTPIATFLVMVFVTAINGVAPFWDTFTTVISLIATYMLAKRQIENWLLWIAVDVIYIVLFLSTGFYLTTALYVLFLLMSSRGYWEWRKQFNNRGKHDSWIGDREVLPVS